MNRITALIVAAKAATSGPWHRADRTLTVYTVCGPDGLGIINADSPRTADYVALANPATILELCALLEKAGDVLDYQIGWGRHYGGQEGQAEKAEEALAAIKQWKEQT